MTMSMNSPMNSKEGFVLDVGKNLRHLRIQRGLSLERLAKVSGVSRAMLSHVELGQSAPTIVTLNKIAKGFEISTLSLLTIVLRESSHAFL